MKNNVAIKVENLGKKYVINHENSQSDDNFREMFISSTKNIINKFNLILLISLLNRTLNLRRKIFGRLMI